MLAIPGHFNLPGTAYVQPKLDGIRCLIWEGKAYSRTLKLIPNQSVQDWARDVYPEHVIDGELMLKDRKAPFNDVTSTIMSKDGGSGWKYYAFDLQADRPFSVRYSMLVSWYCRATERVQEKVTLVDTLKYENPSDALRMLDRCIKNGYEGIMMRPTDATYKHGRASTKKCELMKFKRFEDDEALIIGYTEMMRNGNEATTDELGLTKRSTAKARLTPAACLGSLKCSFMGEVFEIGTGFDQGARYHLWEIRDELVGRWVKFKYQELTLAGVPRFPVFLGLRHEDDF